MKSRKIEDGQPLSVIIDPAANLPIGAPVRHNYYKNKTKKNIKAALPEQYSKVCKDTVEEIKCVQTSSCTTDIGSPDVFPHRPFRFYNTLAGCTLCSSWCNAKRNFRGSHTCEATATNCTDRSIPKRICSFTLAACCLGKRLYWVGLYCYCIVLLPYIICNWHCFIKFLAVVFLLEWPNGWQRLAGFYIFQGNERCFLLCHRMCSVLSGWPGSSDI